MAINEKTWQSFPIAARDHPFNADAAIKRIAEASAGSVETFNMAFLWRGDQLPPNNKNSYRLPVADIVNGRFVLVPHAIFTAAAILQGAHGGLEGVVTEQEKEKLRQIVSRIYVNLREKFNDPRLVPPWEREDVPPNERPNRQISASGFNLMLDQLPLGESQPWSMQAAATRLWEWSQGDYRRYRQGFLWADQRRPESRDSYQLPVADVIDGQLMLAPQGLATVASILGRPEGVPLPDELVGEAVALVAALKEKGGQDMADAPLRPPAHWFDDPQLDGPTPLSVTADGQVKGHLALWNVCHFAFRDTCRMAPHSNTDYRYFTTGEVLTADGSSRRVGRITVGTGHANLRLGYIPAADHYDNTGTGVAVVAAGEDSHGIWVAGSVVPGVSEQKVAELRRSPLSGDWRPTAQGLELVAALAVNTPGFPVVGFTASGEVQSLVAAGMVLSPEEIEALGVAGDPVEPDPALKERLERFQAKATKLTNEARRGRLAAVLTKMGDA